MSSHSLLGVRAVRDDSSDEGGQVVKGSAERFREQFAAKAARVDPSATSTTKWRGVRDLVAEGVRLDPGDVYVATISKPGNVRVRFLQSVVANAGSLLLAMHTDSPANLTATIRALSRLAVERGATAAVASTENDRWEVVAILRDDSGNGAEVLATCYPEALLLDLFD
jgi:hypothetical protein